MKIIKVVIFIQCIIFSFLNVIAENVDSEYGIIITKVDNTHEYVRFSEQPKILFNNNDELIFSTNRGDLIYEISDFASYEFGEVPKDNSSYSDDIYNYLKLDFLIQNDIITLYNIPLKSQINVYSINGQSIISQVSLNNNVNIDISLLRTGVYILTLNNIKQIKFKKQ